MEDRREEEHESELEERRVGEKKKRPESSLGCGTKRRGSRIQQQGRGGLREENGIETDLR